MRERRPGCDSLPPRTPSRWLVSGLCIVLLPLILGTGCSGGGSDKKPEDKPPDKGDKTEESFTGYVSKSYEGDLPLCVAATRSALQKLNIKVGEESGAIFKKTLEAESGDGTTITVYVAEVTKTTTRISIKVGRLFGDKDAARRIHSEIEAELKGGGKAGSKWGGFSSFGEFLKPTPAAPTPSRR